MKKEDKYWFKRRRYGYGWTPVNKQGFILVIGYILIIIVSSFLLELVPEMYITLVLSLYLILVTILTSLLIIITRKHGPKPRWRWGKSDKDNPSEDY